MLTVGLALAAKFWHPMSASGYGKPGQVSVWGFLAAFTVMTAFVLAILRHRLGVRVFSVMFTAAVFFGVALIGLAMAGEAGAVIGFSVAVFLHYSVARVWSFDLVLSVGLAGVALSLGDSLAPTGAAVILAAISIYDIFAVYGSRHMVGMAGRLLDGGAGFAMMVPVSPKGLLVRTDRSRAGNGLFYLGTGDIVLPAMMAVSASRTGLFSGLVVMFGALVGQIFNLVVFFRQDRLRPVPALPLTATGSILAYLAVSVFVN